MAKLKEQFQHLKQIKILVTNAQGQTTMKVVTRSELEKNSKLYVEKYGMLHYFDYKEGYIKDYLKSQALDIGEEKAK